MFQEIVKEVNDTHEYLENLYTYINRKFYDSMNVKVTGTNKNDTRIGRYIKNPVWQIKPTKDRKSLKVLIRKPFLTLYLINSFLNTLDIYPKTDDELQEWGNKLKIYHLLFGTCIDVFRDSSETEAITLNGNVNYMFSSIAETLGKLEDLEKQLFENSRDKEQLKKIFKQYLDAKDKFEGTMNAYEYKLTEEIIEIVEEVTTNVLNGSLLVAVLPHQFLHYYDTTAFLDAFAEENRTISLTRSYVILGVSDAENSLTYAIYLQQGANEAIVQIAELPSIDKIFANGRFNMPSFKEIKCIETDIDNITARALTGKPIIFGDKSTVILYCNGVVKRSNVVSFDDLKREVI